MILKLLHFVLTLAEVVARNAELQNKKKYNASPYHVLSLFCVFFLHSIDQRIGVPLLKVSSYDYQNTIGL
jgi:hypothetical protein